jgi:hypothetical protein
MKCIYVAAKIRLTRVPKKGTGEWKSYDKGEERIE